MTMQLKKKKNCETELKRIKVDLTAYRLIVDIGKYLEVTQDSHVVHKLFDNVQTKIAKTDSDNCTIL